MIEKSYTLEQINCVPGAMLDEMLSIISKNLPSSLTSDQVLSKAKYILTELITNAIKHANSETTNIKVQLTENTLAFIKTDKGAPFQVPMSANGQLKKGVILTSDIMHTLYVREQNGNLYFFCEELPEPSFVSFDSLPEHFGLLIITKSSEEFYYNHEPETGLNTFCVSISL